MPARLAGHLSFGTGIGNEDQNQNAKLSSYYWSESYILLNAANGVLKGVNALADNKFASSRKKKSLPKRIL